MTSIDHHSGTDRCREAVELLGVTQNVIVNIQGDEPFVDTGSLMALAGCFEREDVDIATLARPLPASTPYETIADPALVKVVISQVNTAMYFRVGPYLSAAESSKIAGRRPRLITDMWVCMLIDTMFYAVLHHCLNRR